MDAEPSAAPVRSLLAGRRLAADEARAAAKGAAEEALDAAAATVGGAEVINPVLLRAR